MKLTTIFLLAACLQLSAKGVSQTVSITVKDAPLLTVLKEIKKQTGYFYLADNEWLQKAKNVTLSAINWPLQKVLDECFKGQPLTYNISGKVINIVPREEKPKGVSMVNEVPPIDVRGRVVNENGEPVQASISVKGTKEGTTTNANGEFRLQGVDDNAVLVISGVGIEEREFKVAGKNNLSVVVKIAVKPLDEVQMIAYGTTTKRLNTGNVSSVKSSDIEKQPVNNPLLTLQGRVPGLLVTQNTGVSGGGITVKLQGLNSLNRGNDPLYIIDGVPYVSQLLPNLSVGILGSNGSTNLYDQTGEGSPLSFINPSDIESIDILKDAGSTAIYGSRGANGVILITTKKGKSGPTKIDLNVQQGFGQVSHFLPVLNTDQYLKMRRESFKNDGRNPGPTAYDINGTWDTTRNTNWQKVLLGGTAKYTDARLSFSGGTSNTSFYLSSSYHKETTVFPGDLSDQKISFHSSINHISANQKFQIQATETYLVDNNKLFNQLSFADLTRTAIQMAPDAPSLYNEDGTLNWAPLSNGNSTWYNPLAWLLNKYAIKTSNLIGDATVNYQILKGLNIKSSFGYFNIQTNEFTGTPLISFAPENRSTSLRSSQFGNNNINSWIIEPQITYTKSVAKGTLDVLVGATRTQKISNGERIYGLGYNSDLVLDDVRSAPTIGVISTIKSTYNYAAAFGRINYDWQNKYIISLTGRRDGSSRFGSNNLFHNFWSTSGLWIFSNEQFVQDNLSLLSFGKLRASYGTTGNDQVGDYQFMNLYTSYSVPNAFQGISALEPTGLSNPYLQWEETKKLQFGLDLGFLKDRILIQATYYINRSSNLLQDYSLPMISGFSVIEKNFPALVENKGWEFAINTTNLKRKDFSWSSNFNLTIGRNKLVSYPDLATSNSSYTYVVGQPVTIQKRLSFVGVDPSSGLFQVLNSKGNIVTTGTTLDDRTFLVNIDPKFYGGFENRFNYKNCELNFLFQFIKQTKADFSLGNFPGRFSNDNSYYSAQGNQPNWVLSRWQKPGDDANVQKFSSSYPASLRIAYNNANASSRIYSDASFIRLKNISLSWQLPMRWIKTIHLQQTKVFAQAQNLFTITSYKGLDPENGTNNLPPLRVITFGLQLGF